MDWKLIYNMESKSLSWSDFKKVDIRVGTILTAQDFPEAHNPSYFLTIDFGELGIIKTSAQITTLYNCTELIGKQVIAVVNFQPKQIANRMSECLILGTLGENLTITLLGTDKPVKNGIKVG